MNVKCKTGALLCALVLGSAAAWAQSTGLTVERVAAGLSRPVFLTAPPGDTSRAFIVEQRSGSIGRVRVLDLTTTPPTLLATPYLQVSPVTTGSEQGLLGLAFDPNFATNGYFYVNFTTTGGATVIRRYTAATDPNTGLVNPASNLADPNSALQILTIAQPFSNHNGGWIAFGPDNYLYIGMGDGGSQGDPSNNGQNLNALLAKILRIDPSADEFPADNTRYYTIPQTNPHYGNPNRRWEIWANGVRNPWRNSFDRETGDLWIADVGGSSREEINFQPADSTGGENYGWQCMEGFLCTGASVCQCNAPALELPIYDYTHGGGRCSITGGYVYRGSQICDLQGTYFFADYCTAQIWSLRLVNGQVQNFRERTAELDPPGADAITLITSFGEDASGELYILEQGGEVWRIRPVGPKKADLNNDNSVNFGDIDVFVFALADPVGYQAQYNVPATQTADLNCDGEVTFADIDPFVAALGG